MPYSGPEDDELPEYVKKLSKKKRAQWVEIWTDVFQKCQEDNGDGCEGKAFRMANGVVMKDNRLQFTVNRTEQVRRELMGDTEYLVAPVVAVRPGVLNGELLPPEEIAAYFAAWNGRPVMLGHPTGEDGTPISANDPALLPRLQAGQLFNVSVGEDGGLRGELWLDVKRAALLDDGKLLLRRLKDGKPVEVSTAYWRDLDLTPGELDGVEYYGVARNLRPDHLALLLHEVGACSWQDGCGVPRVNRDGDTEADMDIDVLLTNGVLACADCADELAVNFTGSPRNPYGTHASKGYPGGRDAWKRAWRVHLSKVGGGATTPNAMGPLRGTRRRIAMIAAGMKPACAIPTEVTARRGGQKSPLSGDYKESPGDYGMSRWKDPSDDNLTREDVSFTSQDLKDLKVVVMEEINRRIADREAEESKQNQGGVWNALRTIANALGLGGNAESYDERSRRVRQAWDRENAGPDGRSPGGPWVRDVFADQVVVEAEEGLLSYPYTEDEQGDIRFGQPTRVEIVYKPIEQEAKIMGQRQQILEDSRLGLSGEQLDALADDTVEVLANSLAALEKHDASDTAPPESEPEAATGPPPPEGGAIQEPSPAGDGDGELRAELGEVKAALAAMQKTLESSTAQRQAEEAAARAELVNELAANERVAFSREQLEALDLPTLEGLRQSLAPADYSGAGGGPQANRDDGQYIVRLTIPVPGEEV